MDSLPPFHLAIRVRDLDEARKFYGDLLGCDEGRSSSEWVDFNFFGHQLVCHLAENYPNAISDHASNAVDGHDVPVPHFGAVLEVPVWESIARKLLRANIKFVIEPHMRFKGQAGEQHTMFFLDPSGNALEFKAFHNEASIFAR